ITVMLALAGSLLSGCAAQRRAAWESGSPFAATASAATGSEVDYRQALAQAEAAWQERSDKDKLLQAIFAWEAATRLRPNEWPIYARLARAAYLYADGFLNPALIGELDRKRYEEMHERGANYAELAMMGYSPAFRDIVRRGAKVEDAVAVIGR